MILDTSHALSRLAGMPSAIGPPTSFSEDFDAFWKANRESLSRV